MLSLLKSNSQNSDNSLITESHLQAMWMEQKYFKNLTTHDGQLITVISPGIWNLEAGPDFLKAHLLINEQEYRGDVEIHFRDESWHEHHHDQDGRYDNVILHISLWSPKLAKPLIQSSKKKEIFRTYFENSLTIPLIQIVNLIDLDLYPYKKFIGSGQCAHTLFKKLPIDKIAAFFKENAIHRLDQKYKYFSARSQNPSIQLLLGIAMSLGYKHNKEQFLDLFLMLRGQYHGINVEKSIALSIGICGFFKPYYQIKWGCSPYYLHLCDIYNAFIDCLNDMNSEHYNISFLKPEIHLTLHHIRPLNHPIRRIVYLAYLLNDPQANEIYSKMIALWDMHWKECKWHILTQKFLDIIPNYPDEYWNSHFTFENSLEIQKENEQKETQSDKRKTPFLPLMGLSLKREIILNTFLPLINVWIKNKLNLTTECHSNGAYSLAHLLKIRNLYANHDELKSLATYYDSFSASFNSKTKYLIHRYFGDSPKKELMGRARIEQGAFELHRNYCLRFEASCEGCSFVKHFKELF